MKLPSIHVAAAVFALAANAASVPEGKCLLVLQCGSDWCESGECVRKAFEGAAFRGALGPGFDFGVYDDMDDPTPAVKAENERLKGLRVESSRFPAITCLTPEPRRFFAQLENIPFDVTAEGLAAQVAAAAKAKDEAERLFAAASRTGDAAESAEARGRAFALLAENVGERHEKRLFEGGLAWKGEWDALSKFDSDDRAGWKLRFTSGTGIGWIEKATKFRTDGDFEGGKKFIASLRAFRTDHLTVVQRQAVEIAEYALWRKDEARAESNRETLRRALALGRDTVWGQCALGYLLLSGENIERRRRHRASVRPRPAANPDGKAPVFPLGKIEASIAAMKPADAGDGRTRFRIAQYAVLRRIGKDAWDALAARPGARRFMREFFSDRVWMEDFAWSGKCDDWPKAILALESIVYQDGGRWIAGGDCVGRRFAVALALALPQKDEALLADILDAYRSTALAKRLHKAAATHPVWLWRYSMRQMTGESWPASVQKGYDYFAEVAEQQRVLDATANMPAARYAGAAWIVPWRGHNCLGESVHQPRYYEPWVASGEWILRRYSPVIGGVCGELSKFGSGCANAHGLPSAPVGQPGHCAYTRRRKDGTWEIDYSVGVGTGFQTILPFPGTESWTYFQANEGTFVGDRERRLDADRLLERAFLAEKAGRPAAEVAALHAAACRAWPTHYIAWRLRGEWMVRAKRPMDEYRRFADECVAALKGWRQPLWDVLSPYFDRVAKERGAAALADELVRMAPALRQGDDKIQEEGFFDRALAKWTKPLDGEAARKERVICAMLKAQHGTPDYFHKTIAWCSDFMLGDEARFGRFAAFLERLCGSSGGTGSKVNFSSLVLAASRAGNVAAFHKATALQRRVSAPEASGGAEYPKRDFGGTLISADGLLKTSSTSGWDSPGRYASALDESPYRGNAFHTAKEKSPWAEVVLAGPCRVRGVLVVNKASSAHNRSRQVPIEVQVSEDGENWRSVFTETEARDEYRVSLGAGGVRAKFVRVRRAPGAKEEVFHLGKTLVYGDRLY
ncbi:MAG: discoidin domain-containing protein [Kiritimatiellae bacterium]|nr:discoidin domain-containing protein [Kiritimatiellia bacterium]